MCAGDEVPGHSFSFEITALRGAKGELYEWRGIDLWNCKARGFFLTVRLLLVCRSCLLRALKGLYQRTDVLSSVRSLSTNTGNKMNHICQLWARCQRWIHTSPHTCLPSANTSDIFGIKNATHLDPKILWAYTCIKLKKRSPQVHFLWGNCHSLKWQTFIQTHLMIGLI